MKGQAAPWLFAVFPTFILMDNCYLSVAICGMQTKSFARSGVFLRVESAAARADSLSPVCWLGEPLASNLGYSTCACHLYAGGKGYAHATLLMNYQLGMQRITLIWKHVFPTSGRQWGQITLPWNTDFRRSHTRAFRLRFLSFRYDKSLENRHFQNIKEYLQQSYFLLSV